MSDANLLSVLAAVMQTTSDDPRLPIVVDIVRSLTGRRGGRPRIHHEAAFEQSETGLQPVTQPVGNHLPTGYSEKDAPPSAENHSSHGAAQAIASPGGGLGVCVPVSGSVSVLGPVSPDRISKPPIREDRQSDEPRRRQLREPEYPTEFEAIWAACDKQGSKADALKAWQQVGCPKPVEVGAAWAQWKRVRWFDGIGVPHVSTWLRKFGWKEEPAPRLAASVLSDRERGNRSALEAFVRNGQGAKR